MQTFQKKRTVFVRYIALPQDHGSWVFLISPLLIGLFAGGRWTVATWFLILAAFSAFLLRQPVTIAVKTFSGRRPKVDLQPALFWIGFYGFIGFSSFLVLTFLGYGYLLYLALPGILVFIWHLYLVSRRAERRQIGVEIVGSGVLALAAPAAFWVSMGFPDPMGWWLFLLVWAQSAASIVYAYLRLEQRTMPEIPLRTERLRMGRRAILYSTFNLIGVATLSVAGVLPHFLPFPYLLQWSETLWGTLNPAVGVKPTRIGIRQLIISSIFTILFIITWNI